MKKKKCLVLVLCLLLSMIISAPTAFAEIADEHEDCAGESKIFFLNDDGEYEEYVPPRARAFPCCKGYGIYGYSPNPIVEHRCANFSNGTCKIYKQNANKCNACGYIAWNMNNWTYYTTHNIKTSRGYYYCPF